MSVEYQDFYGPKEWTSNCCGSIAFGELNEGLKDEKSGICSKCKDHASFIRTEGSIREFDQRQLEIINNLRKQ